MSTDLDFALDLIRDARESAETMEDADGGCDGCGGTIAHTDDGHDGHDDNCEVANILDRLADLQTHLEHNEAPAPPKDAPSVDEVLSRLRIDLADTTSRKELLELDGATVRAFLSAIGPEGLARGMANLNTEGK